jgi:hypothetical protein
VALVHRYASFPICRFSQSHDHRFTHSAPHRCTDLAKHASNRAPKRRFTGQPVPSFADQRILLTAQITGFLQPDGSSARPSKQAPPLSLFRPNIDRSRHSSRPARPKNLCNTEKSCRLGDDRPSGETAIGIPIAYPAIFHHHVRTTCPTRQSCCESSDDGTAITGVPPVIRGGGIARSPDMVVESVEASRPREQSGCP